jgi:hypothetical protein
MTLKQTEILSIIVSGQPLYPTWLTSALKIGAMHLSETLVPTQEATIFRITTIAFISRHRACGRSAEEA